MAKITGIGGAERALFFVSEVTLIDTDWTPLTFDSAGTSEVKIFGMGEICNLTVKQVNTASSSSSGGGAKVHLSGFKIQLKSHPDADWYDYLVDTDFDAATTNLPFVSNAGGDPWYLEILLGEPGIAHFRTNAAYSMRFLAKTSDQVQLQVLGSIGGTS